jgi:gamma-glutamylputrescine oxidase
VTYIDSYYSRTAKHKLSATMLDGDIETPVCIIGGGLAGLSTALGLVERGGDCVLLEAEQVGWGASGRNGGFVASGFSENALTLAKKLGEVKAQQLHGLTQSAYALIQSRVANTDNAICQPDKGTIVASWFNEEKTTRNTVDEINRIYNENFEFWPRAKLADAYLTKRYFDGYLKPQTMRFQSLNYALHIAQSAQDLGARIFENSAAQKVEKRGDTWVITTPQGCVKADNIVYACSGYIGGLHGKLSRATLPVATYVLLTEPLEDRLESAICAPYAVSDNRFSSNYYRVVGNKQLLWGGRVSMFHPDQARLKTMMLNDLLSVYPQLKGIKGEVAWGGYMGYARHKMPQIGCLKSGEWYCQGFGGHGMVTTTMGGELVASALTMQDDTYSLFKSFGLDYVGKPFGPAITQIAYWMYQLQDAMKVARLSTRPR